VDRDAQACRPELDREAAVLEVDDPSAPAGAGTSTRNRADDELL
jgi:hypothetical protein